LLALVEDDRLPERTAEGGHFFLEAPVLFQQLGAVGAGQVGVGNGLLDPLGVLISGLAAAAGLLGRLGDVAVLAEEDGGGVADPGEQR